MHTALEMTNSGFEDWLAITDTPSVLLL